MGTCPLSVPITWAWHQRPLPACRGEVTAAFVLGSLGPPQKNLFCFYFYFPRPAGSSSVLLSASSETPLSLHLPYLQGPEPSRSLPLWGSPSSTELTPGPRFPLPGDAQR